MKIDFLNTSAFGANKTAFVRFLGCCFDNRYKGIVGIQVVDKTRMLQINEQFRGKRRATDVLSFPYSLSKEEVYGEIIICPEVIIKRVLGSTDLVPPNVSLRVCKLLIHSICHLLGHDHHTRPEIERVQNMKTYEQ